MTQKHTQKSNIEITIVNLNQNAYMSKFSKIERKEAKKSSNEGFFLLFLSSVLHFILNCRSVVEFLVSRLLILFLCSGFPDIPVLRSLCLFESAAVLPPSGIQLKSSVHLTCLPSSTGGSSSFHSWRLVSNSGTRESEEANVLILVSKGGITDDYISNFINEMLQKVDILKKNPYFVTFDKKS